MCSRSRTKLVAVAAFVAVAAALTGCDREERMLRGKPLGETVPASATLAGLTDESPRDPRAQAYEGNAYAIAQGLQLYTWMNCVGCHHHGGGGMGPPLMDDEWRYGGRTDQIAASIYEGRPRGMPAWKDRLTEQQIWQLAAYVRTLSGQERKDAVTARADTISNTPPQTQTVERPIIEAETAQ